MSDTEGRRPAVRPVRRMGGAAALGSSGLKAVAPAPRKRARDGIGGRADLLYDPVTGRRRDRP